MFCGTRSFRQFVLVSVFSFSAAFAHSLCVSFVFFVLGARFIHRDDLPVHVCKHQVRHLCLHEAGFTWPFCPLVKRHVPCNVVAHQLLWTCAVIHRKKKEPEDPQEQTRDEQWQGEILIKEKNKTVFACKCEAHESTRKRIGITEQKRPMTVPLRQGNEDTGCKKAAVGKESWTN